MEKNVNQYYTYLRVFFWKTSSLPSVGEGLHLGQMSFHKFSFKMKICCYDCFEVVITTNFILKLKSVDRHYIYVPLSREGSLSCHACCDTGPRFLRSHPKGRPSLVPPVRFETFFFNEKYILYVHPKNRCTK